MTHKARNIENMYDSINKVQDKKASQIQQEIKELALEGLSVNYI